MWADLSDSFYLCSAWKEKKLLGAALWEKGPWDEVAHLHKIFVRKEAEGKGIARQVLEESAVFLRKLGAKNLYLEVAITNERAITFYHKAGFKQLVVKKRFYRDGTDAFAMQKELN